MGKQRAPVAHLNNALEGKISYVSQYLHNSALNEREWALLNHNTHFDLKKEMKTIAWSLISPANQPTTETSHKSEKTLIWLVNSMKTFTQMNERTIEYSM